MSTVIKVENLSKSYRLGSISTGWLHKDLQSYWARVRGKDDPNRRVDEKAHHAKGDLFWALKDVSFEVQRGEIVGIIGRNGAGKSTLLKILSRITAPTKGAVKVRGRIASLLEVGTGFHPELTGRENVYLNGAILGMTRIEIKKKFDEIVEFAGVDQFLNTPVKRYSSGMYVRLAFSVAAHLESEILLIDEVLAVGDMEFQKKCLGKMGEVSRDGRTVIFVSHSIPMISSLCTHAFLLSHGELVAAGNTRKIVAEYQKGAHGVGATANFASRDNFAGNTLVRVNKGWLTNSSGVKKTHFKMHESIHVHIEYEITSKTTLKIQPNIHLMDANGSHVLVTSEPLRSSGKILFPGKYVSVCIIPGNLLNDGMFSLSLAVNTFDRHLETIFFEQNALAFTVVDTITNNSKRKALGWGGRIPGVIRPALEWSTRKSI